MHRQAAPSPPGYAPPINLPEPFDSKDSVLRGLEDLAKQLDQARANCDGASIVGSARAWERRLLVRHGALLAATSFAYRARLIDEVAYETFRVRAMEAIGAKVAAGPIVVVGRGGR